MKSLPTSTAVARLSTIGVALILLISSMPGSEQLFFWVRPQSARPTFSPTSQPINAPWSHPRLDMSDQPDARARQNVIDAFNSAPVSFEENRGQLGSGAWFASVGPSHRMLLSPTEAILHLGVTSPAGASRECSASREAATLRMSLVDANPLATMRGIDSLPGKVNYLIGNDSSKWHTGIPTFARIVSEGIYSGVDLIYYGSNSDLEYDFAVAPGADPDDIRVRFDGARGARVDSRGDLVLDTAFGEVRHKRPVACQVSGKRRREVAVAFRLFDDGTTGFRVGDYDRHKELLIDPVLVYSSYLGGGLSDFGTAITVDASGKAYVAGYSFSSDFTHGDLDNADIFVGQLLPFGLVFSYSFFGGSKNDRATGLAVDADGNTYVCGTTDSDDYPRLNSIGAALSGSSDGFVTKLNAAGDAFLYSTLIGGSGVETGVSIALDHDGNTYISGKTTSTDFPTARPIQSEYGGGDSDAFVSKIAPDGSALVYSTYLGGSGTENLFDHSGIAVDSDGNAYVSGDTNSEDFPTKDALQPTPAGPPPSYDAFVSKIIPDGSDFVYSTYLGGASDDFGLAITVDADANVYLTGKTRSTQFVGASPTRPSVGTTDAFVAKLNASGTVYAYLTFIGGDDGDETGNGIAVDSSKNAYVTGSAGEGFTTLQGVQTYFAGGLGGGDVFVARLSPAGAINFSTYLGGSRDDEGLAIAVDPAGSIYITGDTDSVDFLTNNALKRSNSGVIDLIACKIDPNTDPTRPVIYNAVVDGTRLLVFGQGFGNGAVIRLNDVPKKTRGGADPEELLISKKAGKKVKVGKAVQLQVENKNGKRSDLFIFTRVG